MSEVRRVQKEMEAKMRLEREAKRRLEIMLSDCGLTVNDLKEEAYERLFEELEEEILEEESEWR